MTPVTRHTSLAVLCALQTCAWRVSDRDGVHLLALSSTERRLMAVEVTSTLFEGSPALGGVFASPSDPLDDADVDTAESKDKLQPLLATSSSMRNVATGGGLQGVSARYSKTPEVRGAGNPPLATTFNLGPAASAGDGSQQMSSSSSQQMLHRKHGGVGASAASLGGKGMGSVQSFNTVSSGEELGMPLTFRDEAPRARLPPSRSSIGSGNMAAPPDLSRPAVAPPVVPYTAGNRVAHNSVHADQVRMPAPRFCGARFGIGGHLVVFSNINPVVIRCGSADPVCETPSSVTTVSLYSGMPSYEHWDLVLATTARVRCCLCTVFGLGVDCELLLFFSWLQFESHVCVDAVCATYAQRA